MSKIFSMLASSSILGNTVTKSSLNFEKYVGLPLEKYRCKTSANVFTAVPSKLGAAVSCATLEIAFSSKETAI